MTALIIIAIIIVLLLTLTVTVELKAVTHNFKAEKEIKIKLYGLFEIKLPKLKKKEKAQKENKKMTFGDIKKKGEDLIKIAKTALKAMEKLVVINRINVRLTITLKNPMANGIAYAAAETAVNTAVAVLASRFKLKEKNITVTPDFNSETGVKSNWEIKLIIGLPMIIQNIK